MDPLHYILVGAVTALASAISILWAANSRKLDRKDAELAAKDEEIKRLNEDRVTIRDNVVNRLQSMEQTDSEGNNENA